MVEIYTIGGYDDIGRNCTVVRSGGEAVILDMGVHLESYIRYAEDEDIIAADTDDLMKIGAIPNISVINNFKEEVKAIIPTHAHLDHIGGIPYLGDRFDAPIIGTPYTCEVLKTILKDEKIRIKNKILPLSANSKYKISGNISIEFIHTTHSTLQTVMIAVHTKEGIILYANDFKFDLFPVIGKKPNFKRLEQLGKKGVLALVMESTYATEAKKTPSESVAKQMLNDVLTIPAKNGVIIVSTFSSHIARLKSIIEFGKKINRKILFLGRSLSKYVKAAENISLVNFSKDVEMFRFSKQVKRVLKKVEKDKESYMLVVTGHQGEPKAVLSKIANGEFNFKLNSNDHVVFSCTTIPTDINIKNRSDLELELKGHGCRIFKDIHQSGHAAREDLRDLIKLVRPKHIIPAHGNKVMEKALADLCYEEGFSVNKVHIMKDGERVRV